MSKPKQAFHEPFFEDQVQRISKEALAHFRSNTRGYALFHAAFFTLAFIEILTFLLFFSFFMRSTLVAFSIACIFLTAFSYLVLRFYFQAKKPTQFLEIKENFLSAIRPHIFFDLSSKEFLHYQLHALHYFLHLLDRQEYRYYPLPPALEALAPLFEKFSLWCHWEDVHQMKELMHKFGIALLLSYIRQQPLDLQLHASLAKAYTGLYKLYLDPRKQGKELPYPFIAFKYEQEEMVKNFEQTARKALEELKIIQTYAPHDPWIYTHFALIYHDLGQLGYESEAYEKLLSLSPHERNTLFHLGRLYFQQGRTAQALKMYEELKNLKDERSDELLQFYDRNLTR